MHPLVTDLSQYTDTELENRLYDLQRKYFQSRNTDVQIQISNILDTYKEELSFRRARAAQQQIEQNGENGLDSLINIS